VSVVTEVRPTPALLAQQPVVKTEDPVVLRQIDKCWKQYQKDVAKHGTQLRKKQQVNKCWRQYYRNKQVQQVVSYIRDIVVLRATKQRREIPHRRQVVMSPNPNRLPAKVVRDQHYSERKLRAHRKSQRTGVPLAV
jgi:hypothetical protein